MKAFLIATGITLFLIGMTFRPYKPKSPYDMWIVLRGLWLLPVIMVWGIYGFWVFASRN